MNRAQLQGKWKQLVGALQAKWGAVTGDERAQLDGDLLKLEGKLQARRGTGEDGAGHRLDEWPQPSRRRGSEA